MSTLPGVFPERTAVLLRGALTRMEQMGEAVLQPIGISGREYGALTVLQHVGGAGNQQRVGVALGLDRTTTMKLMVSLSERGLVRREPDPRDRRSYQISVTHVGRRAAARAGRVLARCDRDATTGRLSEQEVVMLRDLLHRLL